MSKLSKANYIFAILFLLSIIASIGNDIRVVERYGWIYDKTTIIGNDISTETINMNITVWNYLFMGILVVTLFKNGRNVNGSVIMDMSGIEEFEFPNGAPESWHMDTTDNYLAVAMDGCEIRISRKRIAKWIKSSETK